MENRLDKTGQKQIIDFQDMMTMQRALYEPHKGEWGPPQPTFARERPLWLVEEVGECVAIIRKQGDKIICKDPAVRQKSPLPTGGNLW